MLSRREKRLCPMDITIRDLHYLYPNGVEALRGISLSIAAGEQVAVIGQNGAGKTTLVKHLNGLLRPSSGEVWIGDWDTRRFSVSRLAARVGYVFQNPDEQLFCKTVEEEVAFGPKNLGLNPARVTALVDEALALTGLSEKRHINPYDLSPAGRKMTALASVLSMDTPIVILDEPTTGQDAVAAARLADILSHLRARGKTVITITHDMDFCAEHFTRVIALAQGQVLLDGPARDVLGQEALLAQTYVEPPQLTRLGQRLGLTETILRQEEFLEAYRRFVQP